ncbi:MAG: hypothetical protein KF767_16060 [Bdellovibrionaceae bacterium]|nr:hypothetical protein [Pseudobdellovibrionaceae bacterium]
MKHLVLAAALTLIVPQAFASKARLDSLQGATFLKDTQTVFLNPAHMHSLGQYLTFEAGAQGTTGTKAEGGFLRNDGDVKYGAYLGHMSPFQNAYRASGYALGGTFLAQQNPVSLMYGKNDWGVVLDLSNSDKKSTSEKETTVGIRFGQQAEDSEYYVSLDLLGNAEAASNKMSTTVLGLGYEKASGAWYYNASLAYAMTKADVAPASESGSEALISLSAANRSLKTDRADIYYGAGLDIVSGKIASANRSILRLPLFLGLEHQTSSWLVTRVSVSQPLFISNAKDQISAATADTDTLANATRVAAGVGIKYQEFVIDGSVMAAANGNINGNQVLSQAALTYTF